MGTLKKHLNGNDHSPKLLQSRLSALVWVCLALLYSTVVSGQNVTISPSTGSLIAGVTYTGEVGFERGWSSLWRHNQLPLTLHVSDKTDLTASGVLKDPAGNISLDKSQNLYVVDGGETVSTMMSISLPKGFRFTRYRIVLLNNINGQTINNSTHASMSKRLYETGSSFDYSNPLASTAVMGSTNETKDYVIARTSKTETDMGNNLYFYFWHDSQGFYGATIKSIELYFTAESEFQAEGVPGTPGEIISDGVNMVGSEFTTGKLDLGTIQQNTKSGSTYYSYNYENVVDLTAKNWLYQENAVTSDKKLPKTAGSGNIQVLRNDGQLYYALGNGTYYIETPTETTNQNGKSIPLGYRITGAQIKAHYGTKANSSPITFKGNYGTISYKDGFLWATTYYLQADGTWKTSLDTRWELTRDGKLKSGNTYLYVQTSGSGRNIQYIANVTTDVTKASNFTVSNGRVKWGNNYLSWDYEESSARFYSSSNYAAKWNAISGQVTNPAYTPSDFKLELYGTNKDNVEEMANVSSSNTDATLSVSGLNNDAVKFTISGLAKGAKALITYNLTMEQLNPFINTLDVVCHSHKAGGLKLTQQFTSNDFQVAGGQFLFYVPSDFVGDTKKCKFTFENLSSKYMDETYGKGTTGNARNYLVKSPYYNHFGDGNQYATTGNEPAADKVRSEMCGNKAFKYNNAADLANTGTASTAATLEEYPYSEALYKSQGGTFTEDIEIAVDEKKPCYLFTGDETRYNIAPTTALEHRYYAYYLMDVQLLVKDYDAKCDLKELYKTTCYEGYAEKPMYGGTFKAYETGHSGDPKYLIPSDRAYLTVNMMKQALMTALNEKNATPDQVLYLDYTDLYSVLVETKESMAQMKGALNPNCLIFFPERTTFDEDNYVQKTKSGDFRACKNIVITDKQPFYSPYKITVPAENYAAYKRKITSAMNGKATLATLVLPFSIELSNGVHTNKKCSISLYQMKSEGGLKADTEEGQAGKDFWGKATFVPVSVKSTVPNTPYMVKVDQASTDDDLSFEVQQYGSDVDATVVTDAEEGNYMNTDDYTFTGETGMGSIGNVSHTFTHYGSYSGKRLPKNGGWFYFAQGKFYNSKNLSAKYEYVNVFPFRAYFAHKTSSSSAKAMDGFTVSFDDNWTTGISDVNSFVGSALTLSAGQGTLTMTADSDQKATVVSASGLPAWKGTLRAGQTVTVSLPAGIYVVNGKKVIIY